MRRLLTRVYRATDLVLELLTMLWLSVPQPARLRKNRAVVPLVVSMTSHPGRIKHAWLSIETLLRQTVKPKALILVLSLEEFPTKNIPTKLVAQAKRGLTITWVEENHGSFDKLLPARALFPEEAFATFDDDKFFPKDVLAQLFNASTLHPEAVIGARGWRMKPSTQDKRVHYGEGWVRLTSPASGRDLLMPGGNGCLYPKDSMHPEVDNWKSALTVCATADDIWFWAATAKADSLSHCLGLPAHRPVKLQQGSPALSEGNLSRNDQQFSNAIEHFGLEDFMNLLRRSEIENGN